MGRAVFYFYHGIHTDKKYFPFSWGCWGLAVLTRYTAVLFGPIALLMCVAALLSKVHRQERWNRMVSKAFFLSPLIGFGLLLPWLIRQQVTFGSTLIGFRAASQQLQTYQVGVSMPWFTYLTSLPEMVTWFGVGCLIFGTLWALVKRHAFGLNACFVTVFLLTWFSLYRYKEPRLVSSILPFVAAVGAIGMVGLWKTVLPQVSTKIQLLAVLLLFGGFTYRATRPWFDLYIALGYPILNHACAHIRVNSDPAAVVMASIGPQLARYTNRRSISIPGDEAGLPEALRKADWVLFVSFERGQPAYVGRILKYLRTSDLASGRLFEFRNQQYAAYLCKADLLLERLDGEISPPR